MFKRNYTETVLHMFLSLLDPRHHVFTTISFIKNEQRQLLGSCRQWFMDGTFEIATKGFTQVFSNNSFLKAESGEIVQVPLAFCLMTKRRAVDYVKVFKAIKNLLLIISVEEIVSDFERAIFKAVKKCFPGVHHWLFFSLEGSYITKGYGNVLQH